MKQSYVIIFSEVCIVYWWLCLAYSRHKAAQARKREEARYALWDTTYARALKADKGQYYAMLEAAKAVNAAQTAVRAWDAAYNKAIEDGNRKYRAGVRAAAAAREAAHK